MENKKRCKWVDLKSSLYKKYHDEDWGVPVHDDRLLFEMLTLEIAQAGLSWITILKKRKCYKDSFDDFDVAAIAIYQQDKIDKLLGNKGIVRNKRKIESTIKNANVFIEIQKEFNSFDSFIWAFVEGKVIRDNFSNASELPTKTVLSQKISDELKKRGMIFVGPTIVYAFMEAIGMVNDHEVDCFRYNEIENINLDRK